MKLSKVFLTTILAASVLIPTSTVSALTTPYTTKRLGGQTRFDTAIEVSKEFVSKTKKPVDSVILCSAYGYADSVSVTPFAVYVNAPILLTDRDTLTQSTKDRIKEMNVKNVYAIGGSACISDNVMSEITNMGLSVERIGGTNRFQTNQMILSKIPQNLWGKSPKFVDAYDPYSGLAAAVDTVDKDDTKLINPIIYYSDTSDGYDIRSDGNKKILIMLKNKYNDSLKVYQDDGNQIFLKDDGWVYCHSLTGKYAYGKGTKSDDTANYPSLLIENSNFSKFFNSHPYSTNSVMITSSKGYADAVSAGPLSAITYTPMVFIDKPYSNTNKPDYYNSKYDKYTKDYMDVQNIYYVGGKGIVPDGAEVVLK